MLSPSPPILRDVPQDRPSFRSGPAEGATQLTAFTSMTLQVRSHYKSHYNKRARLPMQEAQETQVQSLDREDSLEEEMATRSSILPGESHGQRSLVGYSPRGRKESDMT